MRKRKLFSLLVLLMTAVTGAWADSYLYLDNISGTSATLVYGECDPDARDFDKPSFDGSWSTNSFRQFDTFKSACTTITVDASCQNFTGESTRGSLSTLFAFWTSLTTINNLENLNMSGVTSISGMFRGNPALTTLDLSGLNTSSVQEMELVFIDCANLTTLDLSSWDTSNVTDMQSMFKRCSSLTTIYVGDGWSTENVPDDWRSNTMFEGCTSLLNWDGTTNKSKAHTGTGGYLSVKTAPSTTYTISLKQNTADADKWTINPTEAAEGTQVTATYTGKKKVNSVKAVKKAAAPGPVEGNFTINANGDKVSFAPGNLQATTTDLGVTWTWGFAEHQWDYVGNAVANTAINGNGTVSENGTVDLFCWVGEHSAFEGAAQYGISNSKSANQYGNTAGEALKSDWGENIGDGTTWRTLTNDEWVFLLTRTTGGTVFGTTDTNYTLATINTDGTGVDGLILFPDGVDVASSEVTTVGEATDNWRTKCTSAEWAALEAKGCVFLPCADSRAGADYSSFHEGCYWSASSKAKNNAYLVYFRSNLNPSSSSAMRVKGYSVRLVKAAE